jgi:hypothetical protein
MYAKLPRLQILQDTMYDLDKCTKRVLSISIMDTLLTPVFRDPMFNTLQAMDVQMSSQLSTYLREELGSVAHLRRALTGLSRWIHLLIEDHVESGAGLRCLELYAPGDKNAAMVLLTAFLEQLQDFDTEVGGALRDEVTARR